jgi:hypothetical protein
MAYQDQPLPYPAPAELEAEKRTALSYLGDALEEARLDGVTADCIAHTALFFALKEFVDLYGEDATAGFVEGLPERVRRGLYSTVRVCQ